MPYWIITAPRPQEGWIAGQALEQRLAQGNRLLQAAASLFEEGGVVLDQFLYPYVDRVILDGGGCLKGVTSLGDRLLVEVPRGLDPDAFREKTGLAVQAEESRPSLTVFFQGDGCMEERKCVPQEEPAAYVCWSGAGLPDGWKDYELRRFGKRWQAFAEMAARQLKSSGSRVLLAEGRILWFTLPREDVREKLTALYQNQMNDILPQGSPALLWREGVPPFAE